MSVREFIFNQEKYTKNSIGKKIRIKNTVFANSLFRYAIINNNHDKVGNWMGNIPAGAIGILRGIAIYPDSKLGKRTIYYIDFTSDGIDSEKGWNESTYKDHWIWIYPEDFEIVSGGGNNPL